MPTRYITGSRDISSDIITDTRVNLLADPWHIIGQLRVILKMDNLGRLEAEHYTIKASIFPRNIKVTPARCIKFLQALHDTGLCFYYEHSGERYLQSPSFHRQRMVGNMERKSTLPAPDPGEFLTWLIETRKDKRFTNCSGTMYETCIERVTNMLLTCMEHVSNELDTSIIHVTTNRIEQNRIEQNRIERKGIEKKENQFSHSKKTQPSSSNINNSTNNGITSIEPSEDDFNLVAEFYKANIGKITPHLKKTIMDTLTHEPAPMIVDALQLAIEQGHPSWRYAEGIIANRTAKRVRTREELDLQPQDADRCPICGCPGSLCDCNQLDQET